MSETPWMDTDQVAAYLGVTKQTVQKWRREDGLPVHRINHTVPRYHRDEVDAWVREESDEHGAITKEAAGG